MLHLLLPAFLSTSSSNPCDVKLTHQTSHGACIYGSTYGCIDTTTMFVKNCSGVFACGDISLTCDSTDFKENDCRCTAPAPSPPPPPPGDIVGGYGNYTYQYMSALLEFPAGAEVQHVHGLEVDKDGFIYATYVNWNNGIQTNGTDQHCLVRWQADGTNGTFMDLGGTDLCNGTPHGLKLASEKGELYLYHANCGTQPPRYGSGKLSKTTLDGRILWTHTGSFGQRSVVDYRPTWWAIPPTGNFVYLADGYGTSNVYVFTRDGEWQNRTFGGKGKENGKFNNCHGIGIDPRTGHVVVADRENHRIQFFEIDDETGTKFDWVATMNASWGLQNGTQRPCNFRVLENGTNPAMDGMAVIADLGADDQSKPGGARGQVAILDKDNVVVSVIAVSDLLGWKGSVHPHDSHFLANGDIVVATWKPGHISYWKKL